MNYSYKPKSDLEKFGVKIYNLLVDNFPQTYFVGGMVRDLLLNKKITDIDITTSAKPIQVKNILQNNGILFFSGHESFGNIVAQRGELAIEVTTLRKDIPGPSRYNRIAYCDTAKQDSHRRDFTMNSLYLSPKTGAILDYYNGLTDIKSKTIRFIGNPSARIKQDPLRIIRALRFALTLDFKLGSRAKLAIKNNFNLIKNLTKTKIEKEILKVAGQAKRKILKQVINKPESIDKFFK